VRLAWVAVVAAVLASTALVSLPATAATSATSAGRGGSALAAPALDSRLNFMPIADGHLRIAATGGETSNDCVPVVLGCSSAGIPMNYGNGAAIHTAPVVYIVRWGWNGADPSGIRSYQEAFFNGIGGSTYAASQTQYCDNVIEPWANPVAGATVLGGMLCSQSAHYVGNPTGVLRGTWDDNVNPVPAQPNDAAIQAEVARAAAHFGNTTAASNANAQYIIDTPQGNSTSGFRTTWCSYHSLAASAYGGLAYTNFPYITDAGPGCGANFVNPGAPGRLDGVGIVAAHEYEETITDVRPGSAWTDSTGEETGDKCAWIFSGPGAMTNVQFSTGTFAVQSEWSNNANGGTGGCVTYYAGPNDQH
jgi:serine protease